MNEEAQAEFDRIVRLDVDSLTTYDADFLRARQFYLNGEQKRTFAAILEDKPSKAEKLDENGQPQTQKKESKPVKEQAKTSKEETEEETVDSTENTTKEEKDTSKEEDVFEKAKK